MARVQTATRNIASEKLSLKDFLNSQASNSLEFIGEATAKGNPLFTNGVETYPIAMPLLKYYVKEGLVTLNDDDTIVCEKGWRIKDDTWQPKARASQEL